MIGSPLIIAEKARARLQAMLASARDGAGAFRSEAELIRLPDPADLVITACEVNELHGTGTLLLRIFGDSSAIISLRTSNFYDGVQDFGAAKLVLPLAQARGPEIESWLRWYIGNAAVRRILCIPYTPAEPMVALAAQRMLKAPLCTYIMDDKNVCADGISDAAMHEMFAKSGLRLVISPEMRDSYEAKYRMKFWVMPPLVPDAIMPSAPVNPTDRADVRRGVLLGNIWGQRWLDMLRDTFRGSGFRVDWYCNQKNPSGLSFDRDELDRDGITLMEPVAESALPAVLSRYPYAVVPSDTLDGRSPPALRALAELSLPSRMVTMMAVAHLPMLVLGSPQTCGAGFVRRFDLGAVAPYEASALRAALEMLAAPQRQLAIRRRAAELGRYFTARGADEWIWKSLEAGRPCTLGYEELMRQPEAAND
jgi:hypothetical protein